MARDFRVGAPDVVWSADITYLPTGTGFLYLTVVLVVGTRWENAVTERFFATLEIEACDAHPFPSPAEARAAILTCIERWYNPLRLHSSLDSRSADAYERDRPRQFAAQRGVHQTGASPDRVVPHNETGCCCAATAPKLLLLTDVRSH